MNKPTILLTGANGFLGSHLLNALINKGYHVVVLKRSKSNLFRIQHLTGRYISYDVDLQPLELAFEDQRIDCVIHTACNYGRNGESILQVAESNYMFGIRVLDACLNFKTDSFFNTDTLLQKHFNVYSLSKEQFVEWLAQYSNKIQVFNFKLDHIYGPKDDINKFVPWVISQLRQNVKEIKLTKGYQKRDFIYIDDVVSAYMMVLEKAPSLARFNQFDVGTGQLVNVKGFLQQLKYAYEMNFGVTSTKLAFGSLPYREGEMMTVKIDNQNLIDLGWSANIDFKEGIRRTLKDNH